MPLKNNLSDNEQTSFSKHTYMSLPKVLINSLDVKSLNFPQYCKAWHVNLFIAGALKQNVDLSLNHENKIDFTLD